MSMNYLLLLAVAPSIVLFAIIFTKDKADKEPLSLLLRLFAFGALSCIPAALIETLLSGAVHNIFGDGLIYTIIDNFFVIALTEEGLKFLIMFWVTDKNKNFNSLFDGLVYAACVSLGFATLENILYVVQNGVSVAIMRAIMSVPGHFFFAVMMGYYYSYYHINKLAKMGEDYYYKNGYIPMIKQAPAFSYKPMLALSIIIPVAIHGFYDFALTMQNVFFILAVIGLVVFLYIFCFKRINSMSKKDMQDVQLATIMIYNKYPELPMLVSQRQQSMNYATVGYGAQQTYQQNVQTGYYNNSQPQYNGYAPTQQTGYNGQPNMYQPTQQNGYSQGNQYGYTPQQPNSYAPQQPSGYTPQQPNGYNPNGYYNQNSYYNPNNNQYNNQ